MSSPRLADIEFQLQSARLRTKQSEKSSDSLHAAEPVYYKPPQYTTVKMPQFPPKVQDIEGVVKSARVLGDSDSQSQAVLPAEWIDPNVMPALRQVNHEQQGRKIALSIVSWLVVKFVEQVLSSVLSPDLYPAFRAGLFVVIYSVLGVNITIASYKLYRGLTSDQAIPLTNEQRQLLGLQPIHGAPSTPNYKKQTIKARTLPVSGTT